MVDLEALAKRARRAAEWSRLRNASRISAVVGPLALLALVVSPNRSGVVFIGLALLAVTVALGWRSAEGALAVRSGLKIGAIPMTVALFTVAVEGWCDPDRAITACGAGCLLAGLFAGGATAWYAVRNQSGGRLRLWSKVGVVASITTALGCVGLGVGSALAVVGAMAAGAAVIWMPASTRA